MIDLTKLTRRKVDMTPAPDNRTEDQKVFDNVTGMLAEKYPRYEGGICMDKYKKSGWEEKAFLEKCNALYFDTVYYM
jgi:hypothetical protein